MYNYVIPFSTLRVYECVCMHIAYYVYIIHHIMLIYMTLYINMYMSECACVYTSHLKLVVACIPVSVPLHVLISNSKMFFSSVQSLVMESKS